MRLANLEKRPDIAEKLIGSLERRPAGYARLSVGWRNSRRGHNPSGTAAPERGCLGCLCPRARIWICPHGATWRSGYATVCKTVYTSSILVVASISKPLNLYEDAILLRFRHAGVATAWLPSGVAALSARPPAPDRPVRRVLSEDRSILLTISPASVRSFWSQLPARMFASWSDNPPMRVAQNGQRRRAHHFGFETTGMRNATAAPAWRRSGPSHSRGSGMSPSMPARD